MRKPGYYLSYALLVPHYVAVGVGLLMYWTIGLLNRASHGFKFHVYFRIVQARRWMRSEPTWKPMDLRIGIGPPGRMPTIDELHEAFPGASSIELKPCGKPDCKDCNPNPKN